MQLLFAVHAKFIVRVMLQIQVNNDTCMLYIPMHICITEQ